jgi:hypothetical protein
VIDLLTGTTGDTLLEGEELEAWIDRREGLNRFFHDFVLSTELGFGQTRAKDGEPANLRQSSVSSHVGLSFRMGEMGFASLTGSLSKENIDSQVYDFPMVPIRANAVSRGFDALVGIAPVPYLRFGLMGGIGGATASYTYYPVGFGTFPGPDSDSDSRRFGAFAGASYLAGPVLLNADIIYLRIDNKQDYGPTNWPEYVDWSTGLLTLSLGARYRVAPKLELNGTLFLHHIVDQVVPSGDSPNDTNWATLQLGAKYALTEQVSVDIKGSTWIGNNKFDYQRIALGFSYRF